MEHPPDDQVQLLEEFAVAGVHMLQRRDPQLAALIADELARQRNVLSMIAAASTADPSVSICEGLALGNTTTEGYPSKRFHAGCATVDAIEELAMARACALFGASYANVQPHSGTSANQAVLCSILRPGDTLLGMDLASGGHLTHGAKASLTGRYFNAVTYGVDTGGLIDYDDVLRKALATKPRLIISGASSSPRTIDFAEFRSIADRVGAYLLADVSHISGLVATGLHQSPMPYAHFVTTSTYKQLCGPRGGLVMMGSNAWTNDEEERRMTRALQNAVFPFLQGTPSFGSIAAKARALNHAASAEFKQFAMRIVASASTLTDAFLSWGYRVLTGGTDNHLVLLDISRTGLSGLVAERALEQCNIIVNRNKIPGDSRPAHIASGLRIGTNSVALRRMQSDDIRRCAEMVNTVVSATSPIDDTQFVLKAVVSEDVVAKVARTCREFPLPIQAFG